MKKKKKTKNGFLSMFFTEFLATFLTMLSWPNFSERVYSMFIFAHVDAVNSLELIVLIFFYPKEITVLGSCSG